MASSYRVHKPEGRTEEEKLLTISFIHHGLDDHWKHSPVQVKVQLSKGGKNGQTAQREKVGRDGGVAVQQRAGRGDRQNGKEDKVLAVSLFFCGKRKMINMAKVCSVSGIKYTCKIMQTSPPFIFQNVFPNRNSVPIKQSLPSPSLRPW